MPAAGPLQSGPIGPSQCPSYIMFVRSNGQSYLHFLRADGAGLVSTSVPPFSTMVINKVLRNIFSSTYNVDGHVCSGGLSVNAINFGTVHGAGPRCLLPRTGHPLSATRRWPRTRTGTHRCLASLICELLFSPQEVSSKQPVSVLRDTGVSKKPVLKYRCF